jgi:hypothetical protein
MDGGVLTFQTSRVGKPLLAICYLRTYLRNTKCSPILINVAIIVIVIWDCTTGYQTCDQSHTTIHDSAADPCHFQPRLTNLPSCQPASTNHPKLLARLHGHCANRLIRVNRPHPPFSCIRGWLTKYARVTEGVPSPIYCFSYGDTRSHLQTQLDGCRV